MDLVLSTTLILFAVILTSVIGAIAARVIIKRYLQFAIDAIADTLGEVFRDPTVKSAMTIIGKEGGQVRADQAVVNKIATDVLDGPKFAGLKLLAQGMGMDLDGYIEDHGALSTLNAIQSLGSLFGFNIADAMSGGMNLSQGFEANGPHPYMK